MREVWAVLRTKLDAGGPPGAFESSLLTAATLCSLAPTVRETLTRIVAKPRVARHHHDQPHLSPDSCVLIRVSAGFSAAAFARSAISRRPPVGPPSDADIPSRGCAICGMQAASVEVRLLVTEVWERVLGALAQAQTDSAVRAAAVAAGVGGARSSSAAEQALRLLTARVHGTTADGTGRGGDAPPPARGLGRAGCVEALGMLVGATAGTSQETSSDGEHQTSAPSPGGGATGTGTTTGRLLHTLLGVVGTSCAALRPSLEALAIATSPRLALQPLRWPAACVDGGAMGSTADVEAADEVLGALLGLGHMARGAPYLGGAPFARALLQMLRGVLSEPGEYIPPPPPRTHSRASTKNRSYICACESLAVDARG